MTPRHALPRCHVCASQEWKVATWGRVGLECQRCGVLAGAPATHARAFA